MPPLGDAPTTPHVPGLPPATTQGTPVRGIGTITPGEHFAHHVLERVLGKGGMGMVWFGRHETLQRPAAIKIRLGNSDDLVDRERFLREARAAAQVAHPHVIPIFDAGIEDGIEYIVMAYVSGGSIADVMRTHPHGMPWREALRILSQAAQGLAAIHRQNLTHRDLKPANLLVNDQGHVVVADFGLVKSDVASQDLTGGRIVGTPRFLAPEMIAGAPGSPAGDLYALGVTAWELLTGKPLFSAETHLQLFHAITEGPLPDLRLLRTDIPQPVEALVYDLLRKNPSHRLSSAEILADRCQRLIADLSPDHRPSTRAFPKIPLGIAFGGVAALAALIAVVSWLQRQSPVALPAKIPSQSTVDTRTPLAVVPPPPTPPSAPTAPVQAPTASEAPQAPTITLPAIAAPRPTPPVQSTPDISTPPPAPSDPPPTVAATTTPAHDTTASPAPRNWVRASIPTQASTPGSASLLMDDAPVGTVDRAPIGSTPAERLPAHPLPTAAAPVAAPTASTEPDLPHELPTGDPFAGDFLATGWRQRLDGSWDGVYADQGHIVAWGPIGITVSEDQGASWSEPVPAWDGGPVAASECIITDEMTWIRTQDGALRPLGGRAANRALGLGAVTRLLPITHDTCAVEEGGMKTHLLIHGSRGPAASGRLVATTTDGAIVADQQHVGLLSASGFTPARRTMDPGRPALATGPAGHLGYTRDGQTWEVRRGVPVLNGTFSVSFLALGASNSPAGMTAIGLITSPNSGRQIIGIQRDGSVIPLPFSPPIAINALCSCGRDRLNGARSRFIAATVKGIWIYRHP